MIFSRSDAVRKQLFLMAWLVGGLSLAQAEEAQHTQTDLVLEEHVMALSSELRCLVCQNQTIADSNAPLAIDLRNQVRDKLRQGETDQGIKEYMADRYGDFVLYRPLKKPSTWLLWFGPIGLLLSAIVILLFKQSRRPKVSAEPQGMTDEDHARAAQLLAEMDKGEQK
jgi:cytochrome c-type biogenesis protein CcmH